MGEDCHGVGLSRGRTVTGEDCHGVGLSWGRTVTGRTVMG